VDIGNYCNVSPVTHFNFLTTGGNLSSVLPYRKPTQRPEPIIKPPAKMCEIHIPASDEFLKARLIELVYNIARSRQFVDDLAAPEMPHWSVFHASFLTESTKRVSNIAFNPIIMAPPTDYSTVYTTLKRMLKTMNMLGHYCGFKNVVKPSPRYGTV
jgi:hypothetical protein